MMTSQLPDQSSEPVQPVGWNPLRRKARLTRVMENLYVARNYSLGNVFFAITGPDVVVVDTAESISTARAAFADFRKVCQLPVSHIIYTHYHRDHVGGASVFHSPGTSVVAHQRLPVETDNLIATLPYIRRVDSVHFGLGLKSEERGVASARHQKRASRVCDQSQLSRPYHRGGYVPPDTTFEEELKFKAGDLEIELYHTEGETPDHLMVWLPQLRALFPGDLFYWGFPMLSNPMKPDRAVLAWARSLDRMRELRPRLLLPSHGNPVEGKEAIDGILANYARAIRFVHDATVKCVNDGLSMMQARQRVRLPRHLAQLPYLEENYGKVAWAVNGIYRHYTGWFDFKASSLRRNPPGRLERNIISACGGPRGLNDKARQASVAGRHQMVLELTDIVLAALPRNKTALRLRVRSLRTLGQRSRNAVERNLYLGEAALILSADNFDKEGDR